MLEKDADDVIAHFALGCLLTELRHLDDAVAHLREAAGLKPGDSHILTTLGTVQLEMGAFTHAVAALQKAVALPPPNPAAWVHLDIALMQMEQRDALWLGRFAGAPTEVLQNDETREALARLCADLGRHDEAASLLSNWVFHPYELSHRLLDLWSSVYRAQAVSLGEAGNFVAAEEAMGQALAYPSNLRLGKPLRRFDAHTLYTPGRIRERAGDQEGTAAYYEEAAQEDQPGPTLAKPWSALAQIRLGHLSEGQYRLASIIREAEHYRAAAFSPDLDGELSQTIALAQKFQKNQMPTLAE